LKTRQTNTWNDQTMDSDSANYLNNRRIESGWSYDEDGRNLAIGTRSNQYDAAGRQSQMNAQWVALGHTFNMVRTYGYDGLGARISEGYPTPAQFYLRSSVLGGAVVEELNASGQKTTGYVYNPAAEVLAIQTAGSPDLVTWKHVTAAGTGEYTVNSSNTTVGRVQLDPLAAAVSTSAPSTAPALAGLGEINPGTSGANLASRFGDIFNTSEGCMVNGIEATCKLAMGLLNSEAGKADLTGSSTYIGQSGLVPIYARYGACVGNDCNWTTEISGYTSTGTLATGVDPRPLTPQNTQHHPTVNILALNYCVGIQFGVKLSDFQESRVGKNGSFTGVGPDSGLTQSNVGPAEWATSFPGNDGRFEVINDVNAYSSQKLLDINNTDNPTPLPPGTKVGGYTGPTPSGYTPYRNFTANDLTNEMVIIQVQIHELGNSLRAITKAASNANIVVTNPGNAPDRDPGAKLQKCVREKNGFVP
jgi:hypothetical protein